MNERTLSVMHESSGARGADGDTVEPCDLRLIVDKDVAPANCQSTV